MLETLFRRRGRKGTHQIGAGATRPAPGSHPTTGVAKVSDPVVGEVNGAIQLDALMFGEAERLSPYLIPGSEPVLIDPGPASSAQGVIATLEALGVDDLAAILLTHIHLDHAGAAGILAERYPGCRVMIHERVAGLLVDPQPLIKSVESVWGEQTESLFGLPLAIDGGRIQPLSDGDRLKFSEAALEAIWTPGHTRAHMAFLDHESGNLFCGDAIGLQLPEDPAIRPSTPPADFSTTSTLESIDRLADIDSQRVLLPHFGPANHEPAELLEAAREALLAWREAFLRIRGMASDELELVRLMNAAVEGGLEKAGPATRRGFEAVNPVWLNIAGLGGEAEREETRLENGA